MKHSVACKVRAAIRSVSTRPQRGGGTGIGNALGGINWGRGGGNARSGMISPNAARQSVSSNYKAGMGGGR